MDNDKYVTHKELEANTEKILHQMDNKFAELHQDLNKEFRSVDKQFNAVDKQFNNVDKQFNNIEIKTNDIKNTANSNKEKINWIFYTAIGGIVISVITTIISNLIIK